MQHALSYVNIAAYKFIGFDDIIEKRPVIQSLCDELGLKGTILLTPEGINLFLAGLRPSIDRFLAWLRSDPHFSDLQVKESYSETQPFNRMLVK
ncbi:MAG: acylphosphatase, partial [Burkholderiales bacterium]